MDRETIKAFHQATAYIRKLELDTGMPEFGKYGDAMDAFFVAVDDQPDIVRCKDCKYLIDHYGFMNDGYCKNMRETYDLKFKPEDDWFCADGEHK